MSRLTGADAYGLMEAYSAVYTPQELTEEQVWEEVETWVNSLLEEGYDLSDYTWEEMYESYLSEVSVKPAIPTPGTKAAGPESIKPKTPNPLLDGGDIRRMQQASQMRQKGTTVTSDQLKAAERTKPPAETPTPPVKASTPPQSTASAKVSTTPKSTSAASSTPAKPTVAASSTPAKPTVAASSTSKPPMTAFQAAGGNAQLAKLNKGLSPRSGLRATPATIEKQGQDNLYKAGGGDAAIANPKGPTTTRNVRGGGTQKVPTKLTRQDIINKGTVAANLKQSFEYDTFDTVLEHLVSEGYADTNESALVIMANMSEEWRQSILDEGDNYDKNRQRAAKRAAERNAARDAGKTGAVPGVGYVTPRRERETYRDSGGVERHTSGARMPSKDKKDN